MMSESVWKAENTRFQLHVAAEGGEIISLWDKRFCREWFWLPQKGIWNNSATQLFPVVGRLIHDGLWQEEHFFPLPAHGFLRQQHFACIEESVSALTLETRACESTLGVWPWHWRVVVQYELTDEGLVFSQTVTNEDETPFWFSLGWHPGFALPVAAEAGWSVRFGESGVSGPFATHDRTLVVPEVSARVARFSLGATSFNHGAVYFGECQNQDIQVCSPEGTPVLEMDTGERSWLALWGVPGADLLCIEPLAGTTDAPDFDGQVSHKRGMQQLAPGQSRTFTVRLRFPLDA